MDGDPAAMPTKSNIESALHWLVEDVQPGDALFFHFSGHGAQQEDPHGYEEDGMNETILPVDFARAGMLTDDEIGTIVVKHLPEGVRLTVVLDCCHSGMGLDLPFLFDGSGWKEETNPYHSRGDVQVLSSCKDADCSTDAANAHDAPGGAMTTALCDVLRANRAPSYPQLLGLLRRQLQRRGVAQRPQLTASQAFRIDRQFQLHEAVPNRNGNIGRTFRNKFAPRQRPMEGPLCDMLLDAGLLTPSGRLVGNVDGSMLGMGSATLGMAAEAGGAFGSTLNLGGAGTGGLGAALGGLLRW